jgi:hypothetical protein
MITNGSPREPKNARQVAGHKITTVDSRNAEDTATGGASHRFVLITLAPHEWRSKK